jgi:hypothetical protein
MFNWTFVKFLLMHRWPAEKKSNGREKSADLDELDEIFLGFPRVSRQCYELQGFIYNMKLENTPSDNAWI